MDWQQKKGTVMENIEFYEFSFNDIRARKRGRYLNPGRVMWTERGYNRGVAYIEYATNEGNWLIRWHEERRPTNEEKRALVDIAVLRLDVEGVVGVGKESIKGPWHGKENG